MTNDPLNPTNEPDDVAGDNAGSSYEPSYSEPSWDTSSSDSDWETPVDTEIVTDDAATRASAPDASPLTEGTPGDVPPTGADGPTAGSGEATPEQQAPWADHAQGQQYQQPPTGGQQYQQPPMGGQQYQQPPMGGMPPQQYGGGYGPMATGPNNPNYLAGPSEQGRNTLQLDYWLSVFFSWIPALIFFLIERDKNKLVDEHTKELLNFNITRMIVYAVMVIPIVGTILGGIASLALLVVAIMGALKGPEEYANGRTYQFPLTFRFIK